MSKKKPDKSKSADGTGKHLSLEELIYQIKNELTEAQKAHEGEPAFFELERVELEVKVGTSTSGGGKLGFKFFVVDVSDVGATIASESVHTVKLAFQPVKPKRTPPGVPAAGNTVLKRKFDASKQTSLMSDGFVYVGEYTIPSVGPGTRYLKAPTTGDRWMSIIEELSKTDSGRSLMQSMLSDQPTVSGINFDDLLSDV